MLGFVHIALASVTRSPEFMLDEHEQEMLGKATANVMRHYTIGGVSQKTKDWFMLGVTAYGVYAPKVSAIKERKAEAKKKREAGPPPMPGEGLKQNGPPPHMPSGDWPPV